MKCLVLTPHTYGIHAVAERVGKEWELMGHDVEYRLAKGNAAQLGSMSLGIPGIVRWWQIQFRKLAGQDDEYDLVWTHQPIALTFPDHPFWEQTIITFHTTEYAKYRLTVEGIYPRRRLPYRWLTSRLERRFYRRIQTSTREPIFTVVSPHLKDEIASFGITSPSYIPNGIFTPEEGEFDPIRDEYDIPSDATLLFTVGSQTHQKEPIKCAQILNELCAREPSIYAVIAGDGPLHDGVRRAASNDHIRVRGYIDDHEKWRWFSASDLFISLAAYEGMPVATLEACSFGLPVILSNIPAHRNILAQYDTTGKLVESSISSIQEAVEALKGRSNDISLPSWSALAQEYISLLKKQN